MKYRSNTRQRKKSIQGLRSFKDTLPRKIREAFLKWVNQKEYAKYILSVNSASNEYGGDGAFFVYLRKKSNF